MQCTLSFFDTTCCWTRIFRHGRVPTAPKSSSTNSQADQGCKRRKKNEIDIFPFFHRPFLTSFQSFRIEIKDKTKETKKIKKQEDHV